MENKATMDVVVHKASLQLMKNESVAMFSQLLQAAAREHLKLKLNLQKADSAWPVEMFADKAVFCVYKFQEPPTLDKYYAVSYTRKADGAFEFGDMSEVVRVTMYEPKPGAVPVKKSAAAAEVAPGWEATTKSIWGNVL